MAIEKSLIENKVAALKKQLEQLQANANAVAGAIQFAQDLLQEEQLHSDSVTESENDGS